jgi:hypothetical protein
VATTQHILDCARIGHGLPPLFHRAESPPTSAIGGPPRERGQQGSNDRF